MTDKIKYPKRKRGIHQVRQLAKHKAIERQQVVSHHYVRGKTQVEIAQLVGVTQKTVSEDLKALRVKWLESALVDFNDRKALELAKIDAVEATAWEEFVKSQRSEVVKSRRVTSALRDKTKLEIQLEAVQKGAKNGRPVKAKSMVKAVQQQTEDAEKEMVAIQEVRERIARGKGTGDPEWLRIIQWCVNQRCLMFGLTKPPDVNVNNNLNLIAWDTVHAPPRETDEVEGRIQEAEVLAIGSSSAPSK